MLPHKAFTHKFSGLANAIISDIKLSHPAKAQWDFNAKALWDTGATNCCITRQKAQEMGLAPTGKVLVHHAGGVEEQNTYLVDILLPNDIPASTFRVTECDGTQGNFDIIIGMDIISQGDFVITNLGGKTLFSFRFPSMQSIDFVEDAKKSSLKSLQFKKRPKR